MKEKFEILLILIALAPVVVTCIVLKFLVKRKINVGSVKYTLLRQAVIIFVFFPLLVLFWEKCVKKEFEKEYIMSGTECCLRIDGEIKDGKCKFKNEEINIIELGKKHGEQYMRYCGIYNR